MPNPKSATEWLTTSEKKSAIEMALAGGMEPVEILRAVLANVYGPTERRRLIVEWAKRMSLDSSDALRIAQGAGLIPSSHPPRER